MVLVNSVALAAIFLAAIGLLVAIAKPVDALNRIGAVLGIVIVLMLVPGILLSSWSGMSLWQCIALAIIGFGAWKLKQWRKCASRTQKR